MTSMLQAPYTITRHDSLRVIAAECSRASELLSEYGLHCQNCNIGYDSIENAAERHGMPQAEMLEMINEINEQLDKEWRETQGAQKA